MQVNMHEAKSQLSKLGEKVMEGEPVIIAKAGKPFLEIIPHIPNKPKRVPGRFKNQISIPEDFDNTDDELIASFESDL